jgi:hypothetical protein
MAEPLLITSSSIDIALMPGLANRHGLITGATCTGKTVTLQVMAERFSSIGVPVFMEDVKGDLSGLAVPGANSSKMKKRLAQLKLDEPKWSGFTVVFWDLFGDLLLSKTGPRGGNRPGILSAAAKSAARSIGSQVGRALFRGILGNILGGKGR